jgi:hypothetical protein
LVDEVDFERFVASVDPLLKAGRDVLWVLAGRTDSNLPKLKKILQRYRMHIEVFFLCYNTKLMQRYGYWKRQRGIANSKSLEQALYVYKGKMPKNQPKNRLFVEPGSSLFNQIMRNVPVLAPKSQAFVAKAVWEASLLTMVGVPHTEDAEEMEKCSS